MNQEKRSVRYSLVIPVYNSETIVGETVDRIVAFFEAQGWDYELILVNDGSNDCSWDVLRAKALDNPHLLAINLLRNYGQHSAILCGLQNSTGDYVITLDDDLQNPPEEMMRLINKAHEGHDLVFGRFHEKKHSWHRRAGSLLIGKLNERLFDKPKTLVVSNFRILRRDVVDRICSYRTGYPYVSGLALMFSANPSNTWVAHQERAAGKSQYDFIKLAQLVMRILFNYSSYPLHLVSFVGLAISGCSLLLGLYYLGKGLAGGVSVPGWVSLVLLLLFLNGIIILILSMLGEYTVRILNQTSSTESYQVREIVGRPV